MEVPVVGIGRIGLAPMFVFKELRSDQRHRAKLFLRDGGSDDEASGKTAAFMQITHSPGFKEGNVCKLHFLWIILSAK